MVGGESNFLQSENDPGFLIRRPVALDFDSLFDALADVTCFYQVVSESTEE
jgi:hypothetical protein